MRHIEALEVCGGTLFVCVDCGGQYYEPKKKVATMIKAADLKTGSLFVFRGERYISFGVTVNDNCVVNIIAVPETCMSQPKVQFMKLHRRFEVEVISTNHVEVLGLLHQSEEELRALDSE